MGPNVPYRWLWQGGSSGGGGGVVVVVVVVGNSHFSHSSFMVNSDTNLRGMMMMGQKDR